MLCLFSSATLSLRGKGLIAFGLCRISLVEYQMDQIFKGFKGETQRVAFRGDYETGRNPTMSRKNDFNTLGAIS